MKIFQENKDGSTTLNLGPLAIILTCVFVVLKVNGVVSWSWLAVLSPVLVCYGIAAVLMILGFVVMGISLVVMLGLVAQGKATFTKTGPYSFKIVRR